MGCLKLHIEKESSLRVTYSKKGQKLSKNTGSYYPFGLQQKGYNNVVTGNKNSIAERFAYSGKELGEELGLDWYDIQARNYDPAIGRWMNIDPISELYYDLSPYNFVDNNPLINIDPNGLWIVNIVGNTDSSGNTSYSLNFIAERGDDLESLSTQLGLSEEEIKNAHPELAKSEIKKGDSFGLSNLKEVKQINGILNEVKGNQDTWNCANFACGSDTKIEAQWTSSGNNIIDFENILKNQYSSVSQSSSKIGSVISYRVKDEERTKSHFISETIKSLKAQGKSDAEIQVILNDPRTQKQILNMVKMTIADERHFSIVVLKNKSGKKVKDIIQKPGRSNFSFNVDKAKKVHPSIPYKPTPVGGTSNPYYNKN